MNIIKRKKEEVETPSRENFVEVYIIKWENWSNNETEFMVLRSFESFNGEILARSENAIEAARDYIETEAPGVTAEQAEKEDMETCTGSGLADMIRMVNEGDKALAEKRGDDANDISNALMGQLLEVEEQNTWFKAFLYLT